MGRARKGAAIGAVVLLAGTLGVPAAGAGSAPEPKPTTVAGKLVSPLSMAVAPNGTVYLSQNFAGMLTSISPGEKKPTVLYRAKKGTEVGAVSLAGGSVRFATTKGTKTALWSLGAKRKPVKLADLGAYEKKKNPDAGVTYGFSDLDPTCASQIPEEIPASYTGIVESHPYGTASKGGTTYVADAAGNTILKVNGKGKVSTVAVLPGVALEITAEAAVANGLPECTVGLDYVFEPVPTDVELAPNGKLLVSLLPGGPEDGSTGANGKVVSVKIKNGKVKDIASGLLAAAGVARASNGDIYVSQLFGGQVSRIKKGSSKAKPYAMTPMPAAVEWSRGDLFVTANVLSPKPKGMVLKY